jgi:hypothetical protein
MTRRANRQTAVGSWRKANQVADPKVEQDLTSEAFEAWKQKPGIRVSGCQLMFG